MPGPKGGSFYVTANGTKIYRPADKIPAKYRDAGAVATTATGRTVVRQAERHPEPVRNPTPIARTLLSGAPRAETTAESMARIAARSREAWGPATTSTASQKASQKSLATDLSSELSKVFAARRADNAPPLGRANVRDMSKQYGEDIHSVEHGHSLPGGPRPGINVIVSHSDAGKPQLQIYEINAPHRDAKGRSFKGMGGEMIAAVAKAASKHGVEQINVHHDMSNDGSGGRWWPKMAARYPQFTWNLS